MSTPVDNNIFKDKNTFNNFFVKYNKILTNNGEQVTLKLKLLDYFTKLLQNTIAHQQNIEIPHKYVNITELSELLVESNPEQEKPEEVPKSGPEEVPEEEPEQLQPDDRTFELYSVLGVSKDATQDEIRKAYRKLALKLHPDKGGDQEKFQTVDRAYSILNNIVKRQSYDQFGDAIIPELEIVSQPTEQEQLGGSSKIEKFFSKYKNTFFVSSIKPNPSDKVIYVYRLQLILSKKQRLVELLRYKIDIQKNPTISLRNLKPTKLQAVLAKDNIRIKLDNTYLVPIN